MLWEIDKPPSTSNWFCVTKISCPVSLVILRIAFRYSGSVAFSLSSGKKLAL